MKKLTNLIKGLFSKKGESVSPTTRLMAMLGKTEQQELACDEVFALLDQYTEAVRDNPEARALWPQIQRHIEMCPDCREEFEGLLNMLQAGEAI